MQSIFPFFACAVAAAFPFLPFCNNPLASDDVSCAIKGNGKAPAIDLGRGEREGKNDLNPRRRFERRSFFIALSAQKGLLKGGETGPDRYPRDRS